MMSAWQSFLKWRISESGRSVINKIGTLACTGGFLGYVLPTVFFKDEIQNLFQFHRAGNPLPLPAELEEQAQQVLEEVKLSPEKKKRITFFHLNGVDVMHFGSTTFSGSALIGVPKTFTYQDEDDVDQDSLVLRDSSSIPWDEEVGEDLTSALVLSNAAKTFAIAREVYTVSYPTTYIYGFITSGSMLVAMKISQLGNTRLKMFTRPINVRIVWYSVSMLMGWVMWVTLKDIYTVYLDGKSDQLVAELGEGYMKGGVEYYKKKMLFNRSMRSLVISGEKIYTAEGNFQALIRTKSLPLSGRLDQMRKRLECLRAKDCQQAPT